MTAARPNDEVRPDGLFTPFAVGEMPENVRWAPSPDDLPSRITLDVVLAGPGWIVDGNSGERFEWAPADCGLGCYCAADAWWSR